MATDSWAVTPSEKVKHIEQFKAIGPTNGFITGEQAKGFFMQSTLPPPVLGVIWMLSDIDGDGKMNQNEFSIACKLINMKLRGFNLPQTLPPSLKQSALMNAGVAPNVAVTTNIYSAVPSMTSAPPLTQPVALVSSMPAVGLLHQTVPVGLVGHSNVASVSQVPLMTSAPVSQNYMLPQGMPLISTAAPIAHAPLILAAPQDSIVQPVVGTVPRRPSQDSGSGGSMPLEWGVPQASKLKFTQVFNMSDRTKSGFLSGAQARNILIQSQLPHQSLAQIWALSDVDNDGRLSCEEFVLAMYLCEQAKAGHLVPSVLPPDLVPPTLRRSRTSSIQSVGSIGTPVEGSLSPTSGQLDNSFEDKRKENFEKGQAELERRRKALLDAQRRETEERLRKEREEEHKREKARLEAERKRQEELEQEMQRQREIESQKETERKRFEEQREQARKEAERQRQEEWENQRLQELMNVRQRQQENLLSLKAKNQQLSIDLSSKEDKVKELTEKISETRQGVTEVKATIDGMRSTRDHHMANMNDLKAQARDQNQRLLNLNQEKARLKARSMATAGASGAETAVVEASVANKQMVIKQLQEKLDELTNELNAKETDANNNISELQSLKDSVKLTGERCSDLYSEFTEKRKKVLALREKLLNPDAAWGDIASTKWSGQQRAIQAPARPPPPTTDEPHNAEGEMSPLSEGMSTAPSSALPWDALASSTKNLTNSTSTTLTNSIAPLLDTAGEKAVGGVDETGQRFQALYQFEARNHDELSFVSGDIIHVLSSTGAEPGWLSGKLNDQIGWFPEAYCTPLEDSAEAIIIPKTDEDIIMSTTTSSTIRNLGEAVVMLDWSASQTNQLSLKKNDSVTIREKLDGWWFGDKNGTSGWFPQSYVRVISGSFATDAQTPTTDPEVPEITEILQSDEASQYYQAVYPYQSEEPGDLLFEANEVILVIKKDGDWWQGLIEDRCGIFPSTYVNLTPMEFEVKEVKKPISPSAVEELPANSIEPQEIVETVVQESSLPLEETISDAPDLSALTSLKVNQEDNEAENKEVSELTNKSPRSPKNKGKKPEIAQVIAPYDATSSNQLSLVRGQLVSLRKKTASGWWEGELHAKGKKRQVGWFPASYVKILCGSARTTPVSMEMTGRDDECPIEFPPDATVVIINKEVVAEPKPLQSTFERVEALYPYVAQNDDELNFEPGDVIMVLDKEDSAWWKGSLRGQIGVFPSNYVQPKELPSAISPVGSNSKGFTNKTSPLVMSPDADDSLCYSNILEPSPTRLHESPIASESEVVKLSSTPHVVTSQLEKKRQNVIKEIVMTESNYLNDLILVRDLFITPMKSSGIISEDDINAIFMNWNELILVSSAFTKALRVRRRNSPGENILMIGDILCQQVRLLTPYIRFCCLQMKGASLLNQKCEEGGPWADVVKRCQEQPQIRGHTLTSFLLKPMQRLTKYPLLTKELLLKTHESHPDYQNTHDALQEARTLCENVNEAAKQHDNTEKLEWMQNHIHCVGLQERIIFNSATNNLGPRKLIHLGIWFKSKSKRELLAFLLSDFLLVTSPNHSLGSSPTLAALESSLANTSCSMYRKPMFLTELKVEEERDSDTAFHITFPEGELSVCSPTSNERNNWLKKINLAKKSILDSETLIRQQHQSKEKDRSIVGRVLISIMGGVELVASSVDGSLQSFCEVSLGSQVHKTTVASSIHPKWDSPMQFIVRKIPEDVLCITVYEKGYFRPNEFLGRAEILLQNIYEQCKDNPGRPHVMRLSLQEVKKGEVILKASFQLFH